MRRCRGGKLALCHVELDARSCHLFSFACCNHSLLDSISPCVCGSAASPVVSLFPHQGQQVQGALALHLCHFCLCSGLGYIAMYPGEWFSKQADFLAEHKVRLIGADDVSQVLRPQLTFVGHSLCV